MRTEKQPPAAAPTEPGPRPLEPLIAQGWILMFLVFVCIHVTGFLVAGVRCEPNAFSGRDGATALQALVALMLLHAVMPVLVMTVGRRWFRWAVAGLALLSGAGMLVHEIHLLVVRGGGFGAANLLDVSHHVLALWVGALALRWARAA